MLNTLEVGDEEEEEEEEEEVLSAEEEVSSTAEKVAEVSLQAQYRRILRSLVLQPSAKWSASFTNGSTATQLTHYGPTYQLSYTKLSRLAEQTFSMAR